MAEAPQGRRLPGDPPRLDRPDSGIEPRTARSLMEFLSVVQDAVGGMQGTPETPSTVQAGADADPVEEDFSVASSSHVHALDTAAPSVKVGLSGSPSEGVSQAVLRADARLVLADGSTVGDVLVWDGTGWVSANVVTAAEDATAKAAETLGEILTELRAISYLLREGLSVADDPDRIREAFSSSNAVSRELKTIAYLLHLGLNVREIQDPQ